MASSSRSADIPWLVLRAELVGTAALVLVGLSLVIVMFGDGSPIPGVLPSEGWRRLITGFLFGTTGASIALSPVGERSGAHINPIVTLAFRLMGKLDLRMSLGYVVAQLAGAILGSVPLLAWGAMGRSVSFGATFPGESYSVRAVLCVDRKTCRRLPRVVLAGLLVLGAAANAAAQPVRQILVLQAVDRGNMSIDQFTGDFRVELDKRSEEPVNMVQIVLGQTGLAASY